MLWLLLLLLLLLVLTWLQGSHIRHWVQIQPVLPPVAPALREKRPHPVLHLRYSSKAKGKR
jgi:hypothetical protein